MAQPMPGPSLSRRRKIRYQHRQGKRFSKHSVGRHIIDESSRGSLRGMIQAIVRPLRLANADTVVVLGHGAIANRQSLLSFRDMLRTIEDRIQSLLASRSSVAEIMAAAPTSDFDAVWGRG